MEAIAKICKGGTCIIQVTGLEKDSNQYLEEEQVSFRNYTFEQSVTLNVLTSIDSKENETLESYSLVPHTDIDIDNIEVGKDGLKRVDHFIIPTMEWLNYVLERDATALDDYSIIYFFYDDKFYKYHQGEAMEVTLKEIMEVNPTDTTLIKYTAHTFELCHLEKCLFNLGMNLLESLDCNDPCFTFNKIDVLNRDVIWMALTAIQYCLEQEKFFKAQQILEQIETCWGICKDLDSKTSSNHSGCGCHS